MVPTEYNNFILLSAQNNSVCYLLVLILLSDEGGLLSHRLVKLLTVIFTNLRLSQDIDFCLLSFVNFFNVAIY